MLSDLDAIVEHDVPLGPEHTWFRIGGRADVVVRPRTTEALAQLMARCHEMQRPLRVLGTGANLLVDDGGVGGIVVRLTEPVFTEGAYLHRHRPNRGAGQAGDAFRVMAGHKLEKLIKSTAKRGLRGLERLAGIPASVGGAIRMNAGGRWGAIGDAVSAVGCLTPQGELIVYRRSEVEFEYRRCSLIEPVILWAEFQLEPDDPELVYADFMETWEYKRGSQPLGEPSAGCVFKNPPDPARPGARRSAGQIIDELGLKGLEVGGARVSSAHANFVVTRSGCPAGDVIRLLEQIQARVRDERGVELEREVVIWRRRADRERDLA